MIWNACTKRDSCRHLEGLDVRRYLAWLVHCLPGTHSDKSLLDGSLAWGSAFSMSKKGCMLLDVCSSLPDLLPSPEGDLLRRSGGVLIQAYKARGRVQA